MRAEDDPRSYTKSTKPKANFFGFLSSTNRETGCFFVEFIETTLVSYQLDSSPIITFVPRVDGRQLITCTRSILVSSEPAVCQSLTQNVRVWP